MSGVRSLPVSARRSTDDRTLALNGHGRSIQHAIIEAVAYADIFDYPLTGVEIHRYLVAFAASRDAVFSALQTGGLIPDHLEERDGYYTLPGRAEIVAVRQRREALSERLWPRAIRYGRVLASLPFVRMVAVTGELAVNNVEPDSDLDYLLITEQGRLWLCRAFAIGLVRSVARRGDVLCPNYLLSERALVLQERNLYTAHELVQMVPISGTDTYRQMRRLNRWSDDYLPNAVGPPRYVRTTPLGRPARALAESALRTAAGGWLESWEHGRKVRRLSAGKEANREVGFSPDWCKGHFDAHGQRTLTAFQDRMRTFEGQIS